MLSGRATSMNVGMRVFIQACYGRTGPPCFGWGGSGLFAGCKLSGGYNFSGYKDDDLVDSLFRAHMYALDSSLMRTCLQFYRERFKRTIKMKYVTRVNFIVVLQLLWFAGAWWKKSWSFGCTCYGARFSRYQSGIYNSKDQQVAALQTLLFWMNRELNVIMLSKQPDLCSPWGKWKKCNGCAKGAQAEMIIVALEQGQAKQ